MTSTEKSLSSRDLARKASRELIKAQNDTTGGGKVSILFYNFVCETLMFGMTSFKSFASKFVNQLHQSKSFLLQLGD